MSRMAGDAGFRPLAVLKQGELEQPHTLECEREFEIANFGKPVFNQPVSFDFGVIVYYNIL